MTTILRFAEILALGAWIGGIVLLSVIAPGVFATLATRQEAGAIVGMVLSRLHVLGYAAGATFLAARVARVRSISAFGSAAALAVIVMLLLTLVSQQWISPRMVDLRAQMAAEHGSVDNTPQESPLRLEFGKLHGVSTSLEMLVLLLGLVALYLTVARP